MEDATTNYALKSMIQKFLEKGENPLKKIEHPQKIDKNNKSANKRKNKYNSLRCM